MAQYVALLCGIAPTNPNMRNEKLRGVFEELGLDRVRTVIASGNVLFETRRWNEQTLESDIETIITKQLGFRTILRSESQIVEDRGPYRRQIRRMTPRFR
jgi:uncharacterized protein (DUF1697 family)